MRWLTVVVVAFALAACGESAEDSAQRADPGSEVTIETFAFTPETLRVQVGETVTFRNLDDILHTATSGLPKKQGVPGVSKDRPAQPDGLFDEELELDDSFTFTFDQAGTYVYYCDIHSGMRGKVIVN